MPENISKSLSNGNQIPVSTKIKKSSRQLALLEFRSKIEDAILSNSIIPNSNQESLRDISLWGVPLLRSKCDEKTDTILIKFLKAKDYKVSQAFKMLQNTLQWRREAKLEGILEEDFGSGFENVGFINGADKFGHPLCYSVYGAFNGKDDENWEVLRWNIQFMEKCIQELDFKPGGVNCIVQIIDLKNAPESLIKDIRLAGKKSVLMFQENYPGLIFKCIIINSPLWFSAFPTMRFRYITQKTKNNLMFVRPSRVTETLVRYTAPEVIPIQYGGFNRPKDNEFSTQDTVLRQKLKGGSIELIQIYVEKGEVSVVWDISVVGLEVEYRAEFFPEDDCSYRILIQKEKKMEESVRDSFYISEPGKLVLTIENLTFKKKFIYFRSKIKPLVPIYHISKFSKSRYNI